MPRAALNNDSMPPWRTDNPFPVLLVQHHAPIRCLDLSASRTQVPSRLLPLLTALVGRRALTSPAPSQLAVVDESSKLFVYDLKSKQRVFEEARCPIAGHSLRGVTRCRWQVNANSVAWNTEIENMLCYSGNGQLAIRTGSFPPHRQVMQGYVVGFKGSKIFCLQSLNMQTIDVPQSASMYRYLDIGVRASTARFVSFAHTVCAARQDFEAAYKVACMGVTDVDWSNFAHAALEVGCDAMFSRLDGLMCDARQGMSLELARKAFIRVRDGASSQLCAHPAHGSAA
jgi:intraflagellar transport protein 122